MRRDRYCRAHRTCMDVASGNTFHTAHRRCYIAAVGWRDRAPPMTR